MENGEINYLNYNSFIYDLPQIEEELGKIILSGKSLFEDTLKFVNYLGEGSKSEIMNRFYEKYKQNDLTQEEKENIAKYIKDKKNNNENYDFKPIFISMKLIIFYLTNNDYTENDKISDILNAKPYYLMINQDCLDFFKQESDFKSDKIMNVFLLFEHLCFNDLCNDLEEEYKSELDSKNKDKIIQLLNKNKINDSITIKDLAAALRRFISRYLVGKNKKIGDLKEESSLINKLDDPELWNEKLGKLQNLKMLISDALKDLNLGIEQSYNFYELIKEQDEEDIKNLLVQEEEPKEITTKKSKRIKQI
jgi:hypothetical protein